MLDCLRAAKAALLKAAGDDREPAANRYRTVLAQYNDLVLKGKTPPEDPCYS